jgi:hypothetical protein
MKKKDYLERISDNENIVTQIECAMKTLKAKDCTPKSFYLDRRQCDSLGIEWGGVVFNLINLAIENNKKTK